MGDTNWQHCVDLFIQAINLFIYTKNPALSGIYSLRINAQSYFCSNKKEG